MRNEGSPGTVLVAAASRHGGTSELAGVVAEGIRSVLPGAAVTVRTCAEVTDLDGVDAVVLGSAVYFGHWLEEARELLLRCAVPLWDKPVWIFSSGPLGEPPHPPEALLDIDEVLRLTRAREHRLFPGRLDLDLLDLAERALAIAFRAPQGDYRDLADVRGWGVGIGAALAGERNAGAPGA